MFPWSRHVSTAFGVNLTGRGEEKQWSFRCSQSPGLGSAQWPQGGVTMGHKINDFWMWYSRYHQHITNQYQWSVLEMTPGLIFREINCMDVDFGDTPWSSACQSINTAIFLVMSYRYKCTHTHLYIYIYTYICVYTLIIVYEYRYLCVHIYIYNNI